MNYSFSKKRKIFSLSGNILRGAPRRLVKRWFGVQVFSYFQIYSFHGETNENSDMNWQYDKFFVEDFDFDLERGPTLSQFICSRRLLSLGGRGSKLVGEICWRRSLTTRIVLKWGWGNRNTITACYFDRKLKWYYLVLGRYIVGICVYYRRWIVELYRRGVELPELALPMDLECWMATFCVESAKIVFTKNRYERARRIGHNVFIYISEILS